MISPDILGQAYITPVVDLILISTLVSSLVIFKHKKRKIMYISYKPDISLLTHLTEEEKILLKRTEELYKLTDDENEYWVQQESSKKKIEKSESIHLLFFMLLRAFSHDLLPDIRKKMIFTYITQREYKNYNDILSCFFKHKDERDNQYQENISMIQQYLYDIISYSTS